MQAEGEVQAMYKPGTDSFHAGTGVPLSPFQLRRHLQRTGIAAGVSRTGTKIAFFLQYNQLTTLGFIRYFTFKHHLAVVLFLLAQRFVINSFETYKSATKISV